MLRGDVAATRRACRSRSQLSTARRCAAHHASCGRCFCACCLCAQSAVRKRCGLRGRECVLHERAARELQAASGLRCRARTTACVQATFGVPGGAEVLSAYGQRGGDVCPECLRSELRSRGCFRSLVRGGRGLPGRPDLQHLRAKHAPTSRAHVLARALSRRARHWPADRALFGRYCMLDGARWVHVDSRRV